MMRPYKEPVSRQTQARTRLGLASLLWMFVGAIITVMVGVFLYLSPLFDGFRKDVDVNPEVLVKPLPQTPTKPNEYEFYEILPERDFRGSQSGLGRAPDEASAEPAQNKAASQQKAQSPQKVDVVVSAKPEDGEITVSESNETYDDAPPASAPQDSAKVKISPTQETAYTYILQVRSYDNVEEADKKRNEVIMAGVDARVVHRIDTSGVALYQVVSAPFNSRVSAMEAEQKLSNNGIDALLIEQRR